MPKPACTRPRAPAEANGLSFSIASGCRPCSTRSRFTAAARSGAVSAKVPSRSNSTARSKLTHASQEVVDAAVRAKPVLRGNRGVGHAEHLVDAKAARAAPAREFRGLDEAQVVVRALGQQAQQILCADDRKKVGLRIAVEGGEEYLPAGPHQLRAGVDHARGLGHVLEQLHAGQGIEPSGIARRKVLDTDLFVLDR